MSGIKLEELEASDMLDVLHYLFEYDLSVASGEELDAKNKMRKTIYRELYNKDYSFGSSNSSSDNNYDYGLDDLDGPVNAPATNKTKPYFPPTPFNPDAADPFGGALREKPLG
jgi:hypothetical protein